MKAVKMRKKKSASLLLLCITVLLAACDQHELPCQAEPGGVQCPCNHSWQEGPGGYRGEELNGARTRKKNPEGHPWAATISDVPERKHQARLRNVML
jgi:hypothetical protein